MNSKQVFDVSKPGKSTPSSTSRPVIVNHGPMLKDPMVAQSKKDEETTEETTQPTKSAYSSGGEKVIAPLEQPKTPEQDKPTTTEALPEDPEKKDTSKSENIQSNIEETLDAAANAKNKIPKTEDNTRQAELEKLVEEKKYFLPIGHVSHRRNHRWIVAFIVLLVVILPTLYLFIDAELLNVGVKLPYEFIK